MRDQLGGLGIGYTINVYDTPAIHRKVVASTVSNRGGQYHFSQLDRIGGETEFKIEVEGEYSREEAASRAARSGTVTSWATTRRP